jgi:FHS family Na+ dependent glucose MFS transporter 1
MHQEASGKGGEGKLGKTATYYAGLLTLGLVVAVIGPSLPRLAGSTGSTLSRISYLFTAHSLGYLLGSLLSGRLFDRVPGHPLLGLSLLLMTGVLLSIPLISLLQLLIGVMFLLGTAGGILDVGSNTLLVWIHGDKVGPYMNGLHFFFGLGALISPVIVAQSIRLTGTISWAFWILAAIAVPVTAAAFRLPSPPVRAAPAEGRGPGTGFMLVALIAFFFFLHVGAELGFGGWIYTYALATGVGTETSAAYLTSGFWGALTVGRLIGIAISLRMKPRFMLLTDLGGCLAAAVIILLGSPNPALVWAGTLLMGLSIASIFATGINFAERNMHISGSTTSWIFVGAGLGGMFFPWFIGQFFESAGPGSMMYILLAAFAAAAALVLITLSHARRNAPAPEPGRTAY